MAEATLVIGATSSLGVALCRQLAASGVTLGLAGRDGAEITLLADDLRARYAAAPRTFAIDLATPEQWGDSLLAGKFDTVIFLAGDMGNGDAWDASNLARVINLNYRNPALLLTLLAKPMVERKQGTIVVICSVAGDRGRQSNYPYGSAKAGLAAFASGLRNRLAKSGVHVMTVKPGFIDTPMTFAMDSPLIASRERVAADILRALKKRRNVIYTPWFWRWIMLIIRLIPEPIFKRLSL